MRLVRGAGNTIGTHSPACSQQPKDECQGTKIKLADQVRTYRSLAWLLQFRPSFDQLLQTPLLTFPLEGALPQKCGLPQKAYTCLKTGSSTSL